MDVRTCKKCGKLFNYIGSPICAACEKDLEKKFQEVKQYVYDNPGANMGVVSEEMDVSVAQIKKWVREERLCFTEDSGVLLECEKCGKSITTGRYCVDCKNKMANSLSGLYGSEKKSTEKKKKDGGAKMRFLGN